MEQVNFNIFDSNQKTYFKRNYSKALSKIIPSIYNIRDFEVSGMEIDPLDSLLKTNIDAAYAISRLIPVSATANFSNINTISGIYPYFVKQNVLTNVTPFTFERDILDPLNFQLDAFDTSAEWRNYLQTNLLPALKLNYPASSITTPSGSFNAQTAFGVNSPEALHEYYINSLGWFYFLNTSSVSPGTYDPSSYALDKLSELYLGKDLGVLDGIKGFEEYLWRNYPSLPVVSSLQLIPTDYLSGTATYTSGVQGLDRLKTLLGVLYSEGYADNKDFKVKDAFEAFLLLGTFTPAESYAGPFNRFIKVLGYVYQDLNSSVEKLESLYEIDSCPDEYLPYLSQLIGWELIGNDPDRWRSQIRNAVRIYKSKGTAKATQLALDTLFGDSGFNLSSSLYELHESYLPNLIYYLLATGSPNFNQAGYKDNPFSTWTTKDALEAGVTVTDGFGIVADYSLSSVDSNIRRCVDKVLRDLWKAHPTNFLLGNTTFPSYGSIAANSFKFYYRDRIYDIPPFEEIRYYDRASITHSLTNTLKTSLLSLNVSSSYVTQTIDFIKLRSVSAVGDIEVGNTFNLFTSGFEQPFNFTDILNDISNKKAQYLSLWSGKSSHFDLHLSADSQSFSTKSSTPQTSLGIYHALIGLNKTIPAHAMPRVKVFLEAFDDISNFLYACPTLFSTPKDLVTSSTIVNAWDGSGVNMQDFFATVGLGHGLSSTGVSRKYVDSITDVLLDGNGDTTKGTYVPRNNLRRRNLYNNIPRNGFFDRTGFNMPNSYAPSTFDIFTGASGGGALTLGYNYSGCSFQTTFTNDSVSSLHPVWHPCETSSSDNNFFGVDTSWTFPWRGAGPRPLKSTLAAGNCLQYVRREELPEIIRVMHSAMEKDAYRNAYENFKSVSADWQVSSYWRDPIQSLANSAYNGVSSWYDYADYTFGSGIQEAYNRYAKEFGRHGTAPNLITGKNAHGGRNIFSHIYGPLLYNGNLTKDGSAVSFIASSFTQEGYQGLGYTDISSLGADSSAGACAGKLVVGWPGDCSDGEARYPYGFSGIEFCRYAIPSFDQEIIGGSVDSGPRFKMYRTTAQYGENSTEIDPFLTGKGLLGVQCSGDSSFLNYARLRFDLSAFGSTTTSGNLLLPDHDYELSIKVARYGMDALHNAKVGVWIHTMPENNMFWSWVDRSKTSQFGKAWNYSDTYANGEWVSCSGDNIVRPTTDGYTEGGAFQFGVRDTLCRTFKLPPSTGITSIEDLKESNFNTYTIPFSTRNKQFRKSGNFLPKPKDYQPAFVHRTDQSYIVEIMLRSEGSESIADTLDYVFENISIIDKTLERTTLDEFKVEYVDNLGTVHSETVTRTGIDDYRIYFKYLNSIAASSLGDGYATRIAADSSGIFEASGGSRLNYRYHPNWGVTTGFVGNSPDGNAWTTTPSIYSLVEMVDGMSPQENT